MKWTRRDLVRAGMTGLLPLGAGCVEGDGRLPGEAAEPDAYAAGDTPTPTEAQPEGTTPTTADGTPDGTSDGPTETPTEIGPTPTPTWTPADGCPEPGGTSDVSDPLDFDDGPKSEPSIPSELTLETAREYVDTTAYRDAYNGLYYNEYSDVSVDTDVLCAREVESGYEVVVSVGGSSDTNPPEDATATPIHADLWPPVEYTYLVTESATYREYGGYG